MKISMNELLIVLAIVVIIFGPRQIPKLSRMFGKTVRNFKEGVESKDDGDNSEY